MCGKKLKIQKFWEFWKGGSIILRAISCFNLSFTINQQKNRISMEEKQLYFF